MTSFPLSTVNSAVLAALTMLVASPTLADDTQDTNAQAQDIERISVVSHRQPFRGDVPANELPQAINTIDSDTLMSQGITNFQNTIDFASGLARQNSFGGLWDSFAIRGFAGDENLPSGYLINGFSAGRGFSGVRDTVNIQQLEVLKGPGSALYGRSEPGGTINIITKKPQFAQAGYLQVSGGSYDHYRAEGDYTNAITDKLAFRVNGAYEDNGSFRDTVKSKKWFLSPSFDYRINDSTDVLYELELLQQKVPFDRGVVVQNNDFDAVNIHTFYGEPADGPTKVNAVGHQLTLHHQLASNWQLLAGINYRESELKGYSTMAELSASRQLLYTDGETLSRQRRYVDYQTDDLSARVELSGTVTAVVEHHILFGIDGYDYHADNVMDRWRVTAGDDTYSVSLVDPEYGQTLPTVSSLKDTRETQHAYGVYLQDQLDLTDHWKALLGARFDHFQQNIVNHLSDSTSQQQQNTTSPRAGLVYRFDDSLSWYTSYSRGFQPNSGANADDDAFAPQKSNSWETGIKFALLDNQLSGTLAVYDAEKTNILSADPVNAGYSVAIGKARSKGIELDMQAWLDDQTKLNFAYAYTHARTINEVINPDWSVTIPAGSQLVNIPDHKGNISLTRLFTINDNQASAGINITAVSKRLGDTVDSDYQLPGYTLVRIFGTTDIGDDWQLSANVNNLLNKKYFASSYSALWTQPGEPRSFNISVRYRF